MMYTTESIRQKLVLFFKIFLPILVYQLANYSTAFIDTMMTGRYATSHLAGVSIGGSIWTPILTLLTGIASALVPIVGQDFGSGKKEKIKKDFYQFIYLTLGLSLVTLVLGGLFLKPLLSLLGLESLVEEVAFTYLTYLALGILPFLLFTVCRSFMDALGLTRLSMYLMLLIVPFNAGLNYLFIYGQFGFPKLGGAGAGLGTALAYWFLLGVTVLVLRYHPDLRGYDLQEKESFDWQACRSALRLGLPIGGMSFAEVGFFAIVAIFMSKFSTEVIAAHQAAINFASLMYAFPLSNSMALAIMVSFEIGAKRYDHARTYTRLGLLAGLAFVVCTLTFLYFNRAGIAALYGKDPDFIHLVTRFLTYSLLFQLSDALSAPIQGILRGYKDTRIPFVICVVSYWALCIPFGLLLDRWMDLGPYAYWIGLILGLLTCGLGLGLRLLYVEKQEIDPA